MTKGSDERLKRVTADEFGQLRAKEVSTDDNVKELFELLGHKDRPVWYFEITGKKDTRWKHLCRDAQEHAFKNLKRHVGSSDLEFYWPAVVVDEKDAGYADNPAMLLAWQKQEPGDTKRKAPALRYCHESVRQWLREFMEDPQNTATIEKAGGRVRAEPIVERNAPPTEPSIPVGRSEISVMPNVAHSFREWLRANRDRLPESQLWCPPIAHSYVVGDVLIVDASLNPGGYQKIGLKCARDFPSIELEKLMQSITPEWNRERSAYADKTGTKASVLHMTFPLSDDGDFDISYAFIPFNLLKPVQQLMQRNEIREKLIAEAFKYNRPEGRLVPSSVTMDVALVVDGPITQRGQSGKRLLLAHRAHRDNTGYFGATWSASFEETYAAVKSYWGGRDHAADADLHETVMRGLREELLGEDFGGKVLISVHAVFVNLHNASIELITTVQLPGTSFDEVNRRWSRGTQIDAGEHDALATMSLERHKLELALQSESPHGLIDDCRPDSDSHRKLLDDIWHPASKARIACCLWQVEAGLL